MIKNAIILCDESDENLGEYFEKSAEYASNLISQKREIKQKHISSKNCNAGYLDIVEFPKHNEKTLFVICSHGDEYRFVANGKPFIDNTINCDVCLDNGLIYSIACSTGKVFGPKVVDKNSSFYGYNKPIRILPEYKNISIDCDNYGLHKVLKGLNLNQAKKAAQDRYNYYVDDNKLSFLDRSTLRAARDSIVVYGNIEKSFFKIV